MSRTSDHDGARTRAGGGARRVVIGAAVGAVLALLVSSALAVGGRGPDGNAQLNPAFDAPAGSCLDWTATDGADARIVDCAQPHLFESVGSKSLVEEFGPAAAFPVDASWIKLVQDKCTPLAASFMGGRYDPFGRYTVGALKPSRPGWRNGDRALRCGLQVLTRSGELYRVPGDAKSQDQADVHPPGTCLAINGIDVGDPVDCAQPHAVEVVGVIDLTTVFAGPDWPDEAKQDEGAGPACNKLAADYAGGPDVVAEKKLTVYWDTIKPESWQAGTRKVDCKLGALLPDGSGFAAVTGAVKGAISIAETPAPATAATATPGAPAPNPPPLVSNPSSPLETSPLVTSPSGG